MKKKYLIAGIVFLIIFTACFFLFFRSHISFTVIEKGLLPMRPVSATNNEVIFYKKTNNKLVIEKLGTGNKKTKAIPGNDIFSIKWSPNYMNAVVIVTEPPILNNYDVFSENEMKKTPYILYDFNKITRLGFTIYNYSFIKDDELIIFITADNQEISGGFYTLNINQPNKLNKVVDYYGYELIMFPIGSEEILFVEPNSGTEKASNGIKKLNIKTKNISNYLDNKDIYSLLAVNQNKLLVEVREDIKDAQNYKRSLGIIDLKSKAIKTFETNVPTDQLVFYNNKLFTFEGSENSEKTGSFIFNYSGLSFDRVYPKNKTLFNNKNYKKYLSAVFGPTIPNNKTLFYINNGDLIRVANIGL